MYNKKRLTTFVTQIVGVSISSSLGCPYLLQTPYSDSAKGSECIYFDKIHVSLFFCMYRKHNYGSITPQHTPKNKKKHHKNIYIVDTYYDTQKGKTKVESASFIFLTTLAKLRS